MSDMAFKDEYINRAEAILAVTNDGCTANVVGVLYHLPSADVVPKSEVEEIIGKFECLLCHATGGRLSKYTYDLRTMETVTTDCINETYNDGFAEGHKECAREIFEEIEKIILDNTYPDFDKAGKPCNVWKPRSGYDALAELKKKYTEEE